MTNKELVRTFIQECVDVQNNKARFKSNHIEIEDFFKPSGKTEKDNQDYAKLIKKANQIILNPGEKFHVATGLRHQMVALEDSELFEFSTEHFDSDSHRILKGD